MAPHARQIYTVCAVLIVVSCTACAQGRYPGGTRPAAAASPSANTRPSPTVPRPAGPAFVLLRSTEITTGARMNFQGQGFTAGEQASVSIESLQGDLEVSLDPVTISKDGTFDEVSVIVPGGLSPGEHQLRVSGQTSGRSGRTK